MIAMPTDDAMPGPDAVPELSILIVAYNSSAFIRECIGSVLKHTRPDSFEILFIDNGSDGTEQIVREAFPQVRIVPSQGNIGFGRGNNVLASHARGKFLLLLNPDTQLIDPAIDTLLEFARTTPGGAWGGLTSGTDGTLDDGNFLTIPTPGGIVREAFGGSGKESRKAELESLREPKEVPVLCGGFMMVSREAWDRVGGFDPSFLLYAEEIDLFTRLRSAGCKVWLTPSSRIIHDVGSGNPDSARRLLFASTGRMHYARRHWAFVPARVAGLAMWIRMARRWVTSALLGLSSKRHRNRRRAYDNIVLRPWSWWFGYEGRDSLDQL